MSRIDISDFGEKELAKAESDIILLARSEGVGRNLTDGQLLAVLQHHGVATRLLDVSKSPMEALFFAVNDHGDLDGRLFFFYLHPEADETPRRSLARSELPWYGIARGKYVTSEWTTTVALIDEENLDPRMHAQRGAFLVGGVNRRYAGDRWNYGDYEPLANEIADICTLRINFVRNKLKKPNVNYGATGWTIRIPREWKADLRKRLANIDPPITFDSMYPPVSELRRLAARELRQWTP